MGFGYCMTVVIIRLGFKMSSWRYKQKLELQQHLYDTAIELFKEQGYDKTSVIQVCKKAGVAKGTFFNYFTSKEAVLSQYMRLITAKALKNSQKSVSEDVQHNLLSAMLNLFKQARDNQSLFFVVCRVSPQSEELQIEETKLDDDIEGYFHQVLSQAVESNQLSKSLEVDVLTSLLVAALTATAHEWARKGDEFNPELQIERRVNFLLKSARLSKV